MSIKLDGELVGNLVAELGGVMPFLSAWMKFSTDGNDKLDKATVHRWMNGQLPKNADRLMRLAGVLDTDPFALLLVDESLVSEVADNMLEIVQHDDGTPAPLQMLRGFFGRRKEWPPDDLAQSYFNRRWHINEFHHDASVRCNFMRTVEIVGSLDTLRPQIFHFAYRSTDRFAGRWLQYGFVKRLGVEYQLRHIHGYSARLTKRSATDPVLVNTWFGPGSAIFRVASLHDFTLTTPSSYFERDACLEFPG